MGRHRRALRAALLALALAAATTTACVARADEDAARPAGRALLAASNKPQQQNQSQKASTIACSASQPCPNPNWSCCAGKCLNPARGLACVAKTPCPAAAVCGGLPSFGGGGASSSPLTCCTADAGVCVSGGTRCCPRERVCGDACCSQGESCGVDANGAARCRSALPRPLLDAAAAKSPSLAGKRTAISAAREAGTAGPLLFDEQSASSENTDAAAERRWRSAGYQEDPCGRATAVLTATRLIGGADGGNGGGRDLAGPEGRATATVRACCEMCATTPGCGHFSFDGDAGNCWLKAATTGSKPAVAKRLSSAAVVASSSDNDAPSLAFAADGGSSSVLQGLWAVPSRAFVSGTLAYAPSPELCPQNRLCSGSGAASCCPGPVASGNNANNNAWTCAASGACCAPNSGPPCGSGCGCGPGFQCSAQGRCVASQAAALLPPQQKSGGGNGNTATAALLNQQAVLQQQPAGSLVNYAAAYNPGMALVLVQDPSDPQACHARAEATLNGGGNANANAAFAFRTNTMIAPRSGGALNRDRPTLAATAAACCLQCAGVANCAHFSWDGGAMACSLYSDRAGADGAAKATRLEVSRPGSVTGDMIPKLGLMSAEAGSQAAAAAAAEAAGARCASPCGDEGLCCDAAREACLAPTGLPGLAGTQHTCCPREAVCGKQCGCETGSSCVGGNTCCPASRACGNTCCPPSDRCSADGKCVRDTNGGGGGGGLQVISGNGVGGPYNRGFVGNWAGAQYTATALPAGEGRR